MNGLPLCGGSIEDKDLSVAVFTLGSSIEENLLGAHHKGSVMRDRSWALSLGLNLLPLDLVVWILEKLLDSSQINFPHGCNWTLFEVTTSVHIQTRHKKFK